MANLGAVLTTNQYVTPSDYLGSSNGLFFAIMQADGDFCVYRGSGPTDNEGLFWHSGTARPGDEFFAIMQADGNFVVYAGTGPSNTLGFVWSNSGTPQPQGSYFAILQNDGNFCVYRGTGPGDNQGLVWNAGAHVESDSNLRTETTASGSVTCTIATGTQVDLTAVVSAAQSVNGSLTTSSTMIIIAYGGAGGEGRKYSSGAKVNTPGGNGGQGGKAQMTTSLESFAKKYNGTMLYLLFGGQGLTEHWGGKGGASTLVSSVSLFNEEPSNANVLLCAGGGGGGSAASVDPGYHGGNGGSATSTFGQAANGAGQAGDQGTGNTSEDIKAAGGGAGGGDGIGGAGGVSADDGKYSIAGGAGTDGFGGVGGPVHLADGPSAGQPWTNVDGDSPKVTGGAGGEGEARGSEDIVGDTDDNFPGEGGGGGGGYGGGGGGGGGAYQEDTNLQTVTATDGGGGGGGGSYAAASTINPVSPPYTVPSTNTGNGYVLFIFP
jgi:hypothetical protein